MLPTIEIDATFGRIEVFPDDLVTVQIKSFGAHVRPELAFFLSIVKPGDNVFDIGGHIGTFAIPIALKVGINGRVVVLEGCPANFEVLSRNINRLSLGHVSPVYGIVGSPSKSYAMHSNFPRNSGAKFFLPTNDGVPGIGLDDLLSSHFTPRVVKMDIEGMESEALKAAPRLLSSCPILYLEVNNQALRRSQSSAEELNSFLIARGYRFFKNIGARNAAHDEFKVQQLPTLAAGGEFFDVLAVHSEDTRLRDLAVN